MLRLTNFRSVAKHLFQRPLANFVHDPTSNPRNLVYSYEKNAENNEKYQRIQYERPIKKLYRKKKEAIEFNKMKDALRSQMERELKGEVKKVEVVAEKDDIWKKGEEPQARKYDKVKAKELYFIPRINNLYDYNNRKNAYLTEFLGPYEIHDARITSLLEEAKKRLDSSLQKSIMNFQDPDFSATDVLTSDAEIVRILGELKELIPKTNYRLYPNIAMYLAYNLRYKEDFAKVWETMETELFKVLHNMSTMEIAKLKYALAGVFPKAGSPRLHKALLDLAVGDLNGASFSELIHLFHAFRLLSKDRIYTKIVDQFLTKGKLLVQNDPDQVANLIYTYANCRLKKHQRGIYRDPNAEIKEAHKLLEYFLPEIEQAIPVMSLDSLTRLSLALMIVKTKDYKDIIVKIERTVKKKAGELDAFQTANLIYAFSKMNDGISGGKDSFYQDLEKNVVKFSDQFNSLEKSRIYYAYANRALVSKDLQDKVFLPWVKANIEKFNYTELGNVAYGLMFTEVTDKELWKKFARNVATQKHRVPINLYAPLKIARYYMDLHYPQWDYSHYEDTCFEAERYFNISRLENRANDPEIDGVGTILRRELQDKETKFWLEWENLFVMEFAKPEHKFGIIVKKPERDALPNNAPKPLYKLKKKILEANRWLILDIDWKAFEGMGEERGPWLKQEIDKFTKKGEQNVRQSEEDRREEVYDVLERTIKSYGINLEREMFEDVVVELDQKEKDEFLNNMTEEERSRYGHILGGQGQ